MTDADADADDAQMSRWPDEQMSSAQWADADADDYAFVDAHDDADYG